jgi:hypothetical protein
MDEQREAAGTVGTPGETLQLYIARTPPEVLSNVETLDEMLAGMSRIAKGNLGDEEAQALAKKTKARLDALRDEEDAFLEQMGLNALEDRIVRGRYQPRLGPRMDQLTCEERKRVAEARSKGGTVTACGCFGGRGVVPAGNTRDLINMKQSCCSFFEPLDEKWKQPGSGDDYILRTSSMIEDLRSLPEYWDKSIGEVMAIGATMYYIGDDRSKVKVFKNSECAAEAQQATRKAWLKDLKGLKGCNGEVQPFIESVGHDPTSEAQRRGWPGYTINALGSCPKSDGTYRVYDNARSINDGTYQIAMPKVYMSTTCGFEKMVRELREKHPGKKLVACKRDAASYFRCFKVHEDDAALTLIRFTLDEDIAPEGGVAGARKGETFVRRGASYGHRSWPMVACRVTNALTYTMAKLDGIENTCNFIDDVCCVVVVDEEDDTMMSPEETGRKMDARFDRWNVPRNKKKQAEEGNWNPIVVWLGVSYDLDLFIKWVADHRVAKAIRKIKEVQNAIVVNKKNVRILPGKVAATLLAQVVGCLISIARVIEIGKTWTPQLRWHMRMANRTGRGVRIGNGALAELDWWLAVLQGGRGNRCFARSFLNRGAAKVAFYTDASGWGFGAFYPGGNRKGGGDNVFMSHEWSKAELQAFGSFTRKSNVLETFRATMETAEAFAMLAFVEALKKELAGGNHIVYTDNEPFRRACRSGRAKTNDWCGLIVRKLWELRADYDFTLEVRRVSTKLNYESDGFSREGGLRVVVAWLEHAGAGPVVQVMCSEALRGFFVKTHDQVQECTDRGADAAEPRARKQRRRGRRGAR